MHLVSYSSGYFVCTFVPFVTPFIVLLVIPF
nr:MAG TPA: hypothetical protein [Caudoviricetes sp.]